ncbi:SPASM domain-containing protein [Ereboglobus luteus]|uniref:SPASM domain-containing protein n=1 Tax=Ereboglobus luteus TaxID=1796921 RepID=UPI00192E17B8|nr:SPASM domain-containing protein [Ereboglobus luteus]
MFSEKCGRALAIEHNGDVYTCDHYVYPHYKLGNVMTDALADMVDSPMQTAFGDSKADSLPRYCRKCPVHFACHGECPKHRFLTTPDGEDGLAYLCGGYKKFYAHIDSPMRTMTALLRQGRAPAEIMQIPRAQWMRGPKLR